MNKLLSFWIFLIVSINVLGQVQTVGLFYNDLNSFNGYTLFNPFASTSTYLIDNCGRVINIWESDSKSNFAVYLLDNGNLLRTCKTTNNPNVGGRLEELDWEGNVVWSYDFSNEYILHHDIEPLPNGNILFIASDIIAASEAINEGRNPLFLDNELWSEQIVEVQPTGSQGVNIVWKWRVWDHLIQDFDSLKNNYGQIALHPELINLNYFNSTVPNPLVDWLHFNSIDYNKELDQIILSARNVSELYIIDHSTTTEEAASHLGGRYMKGGDILYRFGNPQVFNLGTEVNRILFFQHDAQWISDTYPDGNKIIVFNNKLSINSSGVGIFYPAQDSAGFYCMPTEFGYLPNSFEWEFTSQEIYSPKMSGAQQLPNGNIIICVGTSGKFLEVDIDGNLIWSYINPVGNNGPVSQGENPLINNVFKIQKYAPDFSGFYGKDLTPGSPIELNPWTTSCEIQEDTIAEIELHLFLEGPFNGATMCCDGNYTLPLNQPFQNWPWYYAGTEKVSQIPPDAVDWVLLELRDANQPSNAIRETTVSRIAAFLLTDGSVVKMDGESFPTFYNSFINDLYVVICHRNHLSILSSQPLYSENLHLYYNFIFDGNKVYGGALGYKELFPGIWGMTAGDGYKDNHIDMLDKNVIWDIEAGGKGYLQGDYNLDGQIDNQDKNNSLFTNFGKISQVPE